MVLILFGPPGSGKGTQSRWISRFLGIPALSTGEMLRDEYAARTPLGIAANALIAGGHLAGDDLVNPMLVRRIARPDCGRGFLLDGYPRTVAQAAFLQETIAGRFPAPMILHLDVPLEALRDRLAARRQCPCCHRIYNLMHQPPRRPGVCDDDGAPLLQRSDDDREAIELRLRLYEMRTGPVLDYFARSLGGRISNYRVDGDRPAEMVAADIRSILAQQLGNVPWQSIPRVFWASA